MRWTKRRSAGAIILAALGILAASAPTLSARTGDLRDAVFLDTAHSPAERAADLVSRMTLAEKAGQMITSRAPAIPRLRVREYGWWNEAIHGVAREQTNDNAVPPDLVNTTSYPVSLALGSTWNPDLMYRMATEISDEAREIVTDNSRNLTYFSPTVNLARDPRWGRNDETYSEDPLLTAMIAAQYVNGMEGKSPDGRMLPQGGGFLKTATTLKHYAANNSEIDRRTGSADLDERTLREYYTAQFRAIVRTADPASIMTAYNRVNGVPASASGHLMDTLGRQTFGFTGYYTSDCDSIYEIEAGHRWTPPGYPPVGRVERHAFANAAGLDLNCQQGYHDQDNYATTLPEAVHQRVVTQSGTYTENELDASLVRLFTARIRLGEFDDPDRVPWIRQARSRVRGGTWVSSDANRAVTQTPDRLALAREIAGESIVLLKNAGTAAGDGPSRPVLPLAVPKTGRYRVAVVGGPAKPAQMYLGGYSSEQHSAGLANQVTVDQGLRAAITARNPAATVDHFPATGGARAGTLEPATLDALGSYDVVVVHATTDRSTAAEDTDRAGLALPAGQGELISAVAARNPNTIGYLETTGQVDVTGFEPGLRALLWSSYNGQRAGEGLADVLLGTVNPGGRLPFTWYRDVSQLPGISDYRIRPGEGTSGRTYQYFTGAVSYPFGYGLSYTSFEFSAPVSSGGEPGGEPVGGEPGGEPVGGEPGGEPGGREPGDPAAGPGAAARSADATVTVSVEVTNSGPVSGAQVVQFYASTPQAPADRQRPVKRLVGFRKVNLAAGQRTRVDFPVRIPDLAFFDQAAGRFIVDQGTYQFHAGGSSADRDLVPGTPLSVTGALTPRPAVLTAKPRTQRDAGYGIARRVVYEPGQLVEPRLTLTMTDDTRFGVLDPSTTTPLPQGARVSYRSNRPAVVSVDSSGVIRTRSSGVATVTARVSYQGAEATTSFVIKVR